MSTPFFKSFLFFRFFCYFVTIIFGPAPFARRCFLYALTLEAGTLNLQLERIPLNALAPVFRCRKLWLRDRYIGGELLRPRRAFAPTVIIFAPIFTVVSFFAPLIAEPPMAVTLKFFPPIFTVVGIVEGRFFLPCPCSSKDYSSHLPDVSALDILYFQPADCIDRVF